MFVRVYFRKARTYSESTNMSRLAEYRAFTEVYETYKHKLFNYFYYRLSHDRATAEDLLSDTFVKAYERFDTYDDRYEISTWLYSIAKNTLIDHFRKQRPSVDIEDHADIPDESGYTFVEVLDMHVDLDRIARELSTLPEAQQDCIRMRYFEYKEVGVIAQERGMQESAVRKNISRGLARLRELLAILTLFIIM
jgi:RNA polymerase sigma-70 factor (ECF subfamily)